MTAYHAGIEGEQAASKYLQQIGIRVLHQRYRAGGGEIDLVALDGEILCFIEVKYRPKGRLGDGLQSVNMDKRRRLRAASRHYLASEMRTRSWRFDILEITRAGIWYARGAAVQERGQV